MVIIVGIPVIKVIAAGGRGCTASVCLLVIKKKQLEEDIGVGRGVEQFITLVTKHQANIMLLCTTD